MSHDLGFTLGADLHSQEVLQFNQTTNIGHTSKREEGYERGNLAKE